MLCLQDDLFSDWINPIYLNPLVQGEVQEKFEKDSEIELQDFLQVIYFNDCLSFNNSPVAVINSNSKLIQEIFSVNSDHGAPES